VVTLTVVDVSAIRYQTSMNPSGAVPKLVRPRRVQPDHAVMASEKLDAP
jgi:hypothetical protein